MVRKIFSIGICAGLLASSPITAAEWEYEGPHGPDHWGHLSADFAACETGVMQSPIDLGQANATGEVEVMVFWNSGPLTILNNGHTIQANLPAGSSMLSGGRNYRLVQVHFHTPSEHTVNGAHYPMTAHFVHASETGELAVLGVMFVTGAAHPELQKLIDAAPRSKTDVLPVAGMRFDPKALLPANDGELSVYRYMGSLTTPPCSEGVNWHVVPDPVPISAAQLAAMEEIMGDNARPVQPLNGRLLVAPK